MPRFRHIDMLVDMLALSAVIAVILALPTGAKANPDNAIDWPEAFDTLDTNANGTVDFSEFNTLAKTIGLSRTEAAQHFIAMTDGDSLITRSEYFYAVQIEESATWNAGYPIDLDGEYYGKILTLTPNEEVAGEWEERFETGFLIQTHAKDAETQENIEMERS